ncbi:TIGR03773 family transporter-associated surface protein [Streptomyces sp. NPDC050803]|uniref:TIGR03773 family transporter-associated surface protein n=1 Tax=unclassified Streptomyces TaxID=2593676 RepID=UPI003413C54E
MRARERIAVAVALAATLAGGPAAVAADEGTQEPGLGRIAWADGALSLDPAEGTHLIEVAEAGAAEASAPGWDTTGVPAGAVAKDTVHWSLTGLDGPGELKVYGQDATLFDTADEQEDRVALPVGERDDTRWEFSEEGTYRLIFSADATGADGEERSVGTAYTVVVGETSVAEEEPVAAVPSTAPSPTPTLSAPEAKSALTSARTSVAAAADDVVSEKKVLDEGHIDFAARVVDRRLQIHVKDGTVPGETTWREPSSVVLHVKPAAKNTLPDGDEFAFLGKSGDPVWLLDQVQQEGLLWPGWSTDNIEAGATKGGVTFSLTGAQGPGTYALYTYDAMSGAEVLFNSEDGVPDSIEVPRNTHAHGGWAFTKEGTYRLTFRMSGKLADGTAVSDTETVTFVVGDGDPNSVSPGGGSGSSAEPSTDAPGSTGSSSAQNAKGSDSSGSMASTGAGSPALVGATAAGLALAGGGAVWAVRRRRRGGEA